MQPKTIASFAIVQIYSGAITQRSRLFLQLVLWSSVYWSSQSLANLFYTGGMVLLEWLCNYSK